MSAINTVSAARAFANTMIVLLENSGEYEGKKFVGSARTENGEPFLLVEGKHPISFEPTEEGTIVFTNTKLKDVAKFTLNHANPVRNELEAYCQTNGLIYQYNFRANPMEKAIITATLSNTVRQFELHGDQATEELIIGGVLEETMGNFAQAIKVVAPEMMDHEETSLADAMIAAGMTPTREEAAPVRPSAMLANTHQEATMKKVEAAPVVTEAKHNPVNLLGRVADETDTSRAEALIGILSQGQDLNEDEKTMLNTLRTMVAKTKARRDKLEETLKDNSNIVAHTVGRRLRSHLVPYGLYQRHLA